MKSFMCRDAGVDCDAKFTGQTDDDVLNQAMDHGREKHGIKDFTQELKAKVLGAIRDDGSSKDIKEEKGGDVSAA